MRFLLGLTLALTACAETIPLSLQKAVEIALAPDGAARAQLAAEQIRAADARAKQARAALLPNVDGSLNYRNQTTNLGAFGIQFPSIPGFQFAQIVGPFSVYDLRGNVTQSVFDFSSIRRFQAGKLGIATAKADNQAARDAVADGVARAYLAALRTEASRDTQKANVELSEALLRLAQSQKNAGTGLAIEVTRAQVQLANDKQRLVVATSEVERAHLQLLRVMGLKLEAAPELTDKMIYQPVDPAETAKALDTAREKRAELDAQFKRVETARLNYSASKFERLPTVGFFADYGTIGSSAADAHPTYTYGMSIRVPLYNGGRTDARRAESASLLRSEEIRGRDLRNQIDLEVRLALEDLRSAAGQVDVSKEGLQLAENELAQARRRYEGGVANSIEVTDAQTRLQRARDNQIAAIYNHNLARIELASATGKIQESLVH
ncbi:MAG: TolC family protein [Bryobacteraceae bacterium]